MHWALYGGFSFSVKTSDQICKKKKNDTVEQPSRKDSLRREDSTCELDMENVSAQVPRNKNRQTALTKIAKTLTVFVSSKSMNVSGYPIIVPISGVTPGKLSFRVF